MPTINLTNNTDVILTATSADDNSTLNRYLKSVLTFKTPPTFDSISGLLVKDQHELDFPITLAATGEGSFALEKTTLDIQLGASASIGLLQGSDESDFFSGLNLTGDLSSPGLVSFGLTGTLAAEESATTSDFTFGIAKGASFALTGYHAAAPGEKLLDAVKIAVHGLTIPHDITDLESLPDGAVCTLDANSSLTFSASFTYSFLNDPLAAASVESLPSFDISATASATIEGSVTHESDHILTIAKIPTGLLHLSVSLTNTGDFETSLTVSAGATAKIGNQDALAFLLDKINPNSAAEADAIASQMADAAQFKSDIKSAIDASLSAALAASLRVSLDTSTAKNRLFVYEIDTGLLDEISKPALQSALTGNFTALTAAGAKLPGIKLLDSALTVTATHTHTLALHFLGIFNAASIDKFVAESKIDFTSDTHEIVLSDESIEVVDDNLDAAKLRKLVLKDMTLTLSASANTKDVSTTVTLAYIDREGSASRSKMRQFVNTLNYLHAPGAAAAQALLGRDQDHFGVCLLSLALTLDPVQCRKLFVGPNGAYDWKVYAAAYCSVEKAILAGDHNSAERSLLFNANPRTWGDLHAAGAAPNIERILVRLGMSEVQARLSVTDVITAVWWADAMAAYAKALDNSKPLEAAGKQVVKNSTIGYSEPWMVLASWKLTGEPAINAELVTSLPKPVLAAGQ